MHFFQSQIGNNNSGERIRNKLNLYAPVDIPVLNYIIPLWESDDMSSVGNMDNREVNEAPCHVHE